MRREHRVHFYDSDAANVASAVDFLRPAMSGGVAVVVATPVHRRAISGALMPAEGDDAESSARFRLMTVDAEQALNQFMVDGMPDPKAFGDVIGEPLRVAAEAPGPVIVYGEMVSVLWQRGEVVAAIALEDLWNDLGQAQAFSLLCGYPWALFTSADAAQFQTVCAQHTAVTIAPDSRIRSEGPVAWHNQHEKAVERWRFPGEPTSGRLARQRLRPLLRAWRLGDVSHDAELLMTELINNVVMHARSPVVVTVRHRGLTLRVEVTDVGGGVLRRPGADVAATYGRGLMMVEALSSAWGADMHGESKTVWFELTAGASLPG